uniref:BRCT domain-containing protein n=1 Tax=Musa acuminata subsp. malaccensis TaxID=214687 RepID=A0A804JKA8_MUSAM|nr:PREDICTED: DNA topoisomerase 2-binding protein 1 isoform X1 [Musa acuminata subsp. malaccensis]
MATVWKGMTFAGANVFLSRSLVPPEVFDALHDALKLNGATVFLCCDPSCSGPNDYHVIASPDHEKFADLRAKGCKLLGPQCILSCAKEHRSLPKQGYTCCLAMDGVKVLASGFDKDEKVHIERLVTAMGGVLQTKTSQDVNFFIVKNVLAAKYKWALNILKKPIVGMSWLRQCWTEHRVVPQEAYRILPFTGLTICVTRISADERKELEKLILQNGGCYSADLTKKCTHLVSDAPEGDKYVVARRWGHIHIVTRRWVDQSVAVKACLDEGLHPVQVNSFSCSDARSFQKEQRCHEHSNATSQTVSPLMVEDLEATSSQNISSSFSDATKLKNEGMDSAAVQLKDEKMLNSHVAEDSESDDNDLYLSNCRILLVGFEEVKLNRLVTMIRNGGGTRHMILNEKLTHIIIGEPSESEKKEVRRLAVWGVINVVKATWLEECDQAKKELAVSTRHLASELLFSKASSCFIVESSADSTRKVKHFAGTPCSTVVHVSEDKKFGEELFSEKNCREERVKGDVNVSNISGLATTTEKLKQYRAENSLTQGGQKLKATSTMDFPSRRSTDTFKGKTFCFSNSFPEDRRAQVIEWVGEGGGMMVDDHHKMNANFIIERHGLLHVPAGASQTTVVSTQWIRSCLEEVCIQDVGSHVIYSPLCCSIPLPGFESLRFCVSQYEEKERLLLRNLCFTLGAKFTEKLTKKVTHLLCKFTSGPKYEAACKWGIQPITAEWINECVSQNMMVAVDPFRPKPVTTEDGEAGICTVSQYPTQAACMIYGCVPSQLPSEFQELNVNTTRKTGHCQEEYVSALGKRSRLSECDSNGDASKKTKVPEDQVGPDAVPDVADAIEDLLAQSSKIQDIKSPPQSGCDQTLQIFSSDHSILRQENENSSSTFGISKHWTSRTPKEVTAPDSSCQERSHSTYDVFSETQTESQVVGYEEDLSGRQKIIDRVRSQSLTPAPDGLNQF